MIVGPSLFIGFAGKKESRRADSKRFSAPATSVRLMVAEGCRRLHIPLRKGVLCSLHRRLPPRERLHEVEVVPRSIFAFSFLRVISLTTELAPVSLPPPHLGAKRPLTSPIAPRRPTAPRGRCEPHSGAGSQ